MKQFLFLILVVFAVSLRLVIANDDIGNDPIGNTYVQIAGYVGNTNAKYVVLEANGRKQILPRSAFPKGQKLDWGNFVVARIKLRELSEPTPAFVN